MLCCAVVWNYMVGFIQFDIIFLLRRTFSQLDGSSWASFSVDNLKIESISNNLPDMKRIKDTYVYDKVIKNRKP